LKRYYCKAYYNYPVKGNFNSEKAFASSISLVCSSDISCCGDPNVEKKYEPLDFKELFIYKVLEFLEIGPRVHFFKVPVLKDGFFIMTEDLSTPNGKFTEMGKINSRLENHLISELMKLQEGETDQSKYKTFQALRGLLELDTINRIFKLHDSNDGNFGFINTTPSESSSPLRISLRMAQKWLSQEHEFKIVDFIAPENNKSKDTPNEESPNKESPNKESPNKDTPENCYVVDDIFETFLAGNTVTKYAKGRLMDVAICRHFDEDIKENIEEDIEEDIKEDIKENELKEKHKVEKIFFGKQVIQSLDQRFSKFGGLMPLLVQAKTDVVTFLRKEKCEEISDEYLGEGLADIDKYIEGVAQNYAELKKAIETAVIEVPAIEADASIADS